MAEAALKDFDEAPNRIERPGESVVVDYEFHGDVVAGTVVVKGGSVHGSIEALEVYVDGMVEGRVSAKLLTVSAEGALHGEGHGEVARISGKVRGLLIADTVLVKKSARVEGYVLADSWGVEPGAQVKATIYAEDGISTRADLVETARTGLARAAAKASAPQERPRPVPERIVDEPSHEEIRIADARAVAKGPDADDRLERDLRETVIRELAQPAQEPIVLASARPVMPKPMEEAAIGRLFRLDGSESASGRPHIL